MIGGLHLEKPHKCCPAGTVFKHKYHKTLGCFFFSIVIFQVSFCKNKSVLLLKPKVLHIAPKCTSAVLIYAEKLIQSWRDFDLVLSKSQDQ